MKENKYDDPVFFQKYSEMERSQKGLAAAGEWKTLERMLPDFQGKRVLDLGCGYGWHCEYASRHGATRVLGIDLSERMLATARAEHSRPGVEYRRMAMEEMDFGPNSFDIVMSSLALHYCASFHDIARRVSRCLVSGGDFVLSTEHPVFTAQGSQDWCYDERGEIRHFPVDRYFEEGARSAVFLGETVVKYHRTLTTILQGLLRSGFAITDFAEPQPDDRLIQTVPGMRDEMRRPMMMIVSARKL